MAPVKKRPSPSNMPSRRTGASPRRSRESKESAARYRALFEQSPYGVVLIDMAGSVLEFNDAAHNDLGYTRKEFAKLRIADIDPFETPEQIQQSIQNTMQRGRAEFDVKHRAKNGDIRDVHVITQVIELSGQPVFHTIWQDVTERRRTEAAARSSEEKFSTLFDAVDDAIFILDEQGKFIEINRAAHERLGYTREEMLSMSLGQLDAPEFAPLVPRRIAEVSEKGSAIHESAHVRKDGTVMPVEVNAKIITYGGRKAIISVIRDITERKKTEDALRKNERFLQTIIETEPECIKLLDEQGHLLMMNRAGLAMIQADSFEQLRGGRICALVAEPYRAAFDGITRDVFRGRSRTLAFEAIGLRGRRIWLETHAVPLRDEKDEIIAALGITRDVTERKKLEEDLLRVQKLDSIGVLAGGIAHDFNNLLTGIMGNISLAKRFAHDGPLVLERLEDAGRASVRARDLTLQLLTFARGNEPSREAASVAHLIREMTSFALRGSNVVCRYTIPDDVLNVYIDEGQISQVINNLIINAKQAMPDGGEIEIRCENVTLDGSAGLPLRPGAYVKVDVADSGIGIPKENLSKIFDPYFSTKEEGRGLGLTSCYSIMRKHEGHIAVASEPGQGTTVSLYLPATQGTIRKQTGDANALVRGKGPVLVMDDEELVRRIAGAMLTALGFTVTFAHDGGEAIEKYRAATGAGEPYVIVIMDLTIPGKMGGKEALLKLREIDPSVKAIVSSGYSHDATTANLQELGFKGVLAKPYTLEDMSRVIAAVLAAT